MRSVFSAFLIVLATASAAATEHPIDLAGAWNFALDPLDRGEALGWHRPAGNWTGGTPHGAEGWDTATVPHDYLTDRRYQYTGTAWYRRSVAAPATGSGEARTWRLQFDTVFQRCRVWLNGQLVGTHEGGYTPFEFDVTRHVRAGRQNFLVVAVDNRVQLRALPGARTGSSNNAQVYPWLNYGGILGGVRLVAHAPVYIAHQRIEARPDAAGGDASVAVHVRVRNAGTEPQSARVRVELPGAVVLEQALEIAAGVEATATLRGSIPAKAATRWTLDQPALHRARTVVSAGTATHAREDVFGFRTIEVRDGRFVLNGTPVRLGGANRARGHPVHGGRDPDEAVEQDMRLMKNAGLRFARLQHTAPGRNLLEWADREGMLLILEVGMWGQPAADMASPDLRAQFQAEMRELMALAVNHPSVVGWSLGNEYESWTREGIDWTRDMAAFVKSIDPTRPVTFPALGTALRRLQTDPRAEHAFDLVDFISLNIYFPPAEVAGMIDPVHERWPAKPVFITEYGLRADRVKNEQERLDHFDQISALVRARPWICGLAYWSFNDYPSRYPGTGADGYRRWGLVDEFRQPRPLYPRMQQALQHGLGEP